MSQEWQEIARFGKKAVASGLTSSRFGNISLRREGRVFITSAGSMLDELDRNQVVEVGLTEGCCPKNASSETCVHLAIYRSTSFQAVIHTHSPYAVALSLLEEGSVEPIDGEGLIFLGVMPIVLGGFGTEELAESVSSALKGRNACIARGHGVFAGGKSLTDAYTAACMAEHSSQVRYLVRAFGNQPKRRERTSSASL
jgi:L-fuculose-phosphate aldolase